MPANDDGVFSVQALCTPATGPQATEASEDGSLCDLLALAVSCRVAFPRTDAHKRGQLHVVVAPGRVNLIGEHIDYEGYGVLPMAIDRHVRIAFVSGAGGHHDVGGEDPALRFSLKNADLRYGAFTIALSAQDWCRTRDDPAALFRALVAHTTALVSPIEASTEASVSSSSTAWSRYFLCGFLAVLAWKPALATRPLTLQALVDGDVPPASGLSSSSAMVVASALTVATALCTETGEPMPSRAALADCCRRAERYVGTIGGGMDQAACCLARRGAALSITFSPLTACPVWFPSGFADAYVFVVVNSMVSAEKAVEGATSFNRRVVECALAAKVIACTQLDLPEWKQVTQLVEVQHALDRSVGRDSSSNARADALEDLLAATFKQDEYFPHELEKLLRDEPVTNLFTGTHLEHAAQLVLSDNTTPLRLAQRVRHVWSETDRVSRFCGLASSDSSTQTPKLSHDELAKQLGGLMLASHASCRDAYECSCPALDELVSLAVNEGGASGARLTGAGWGGCMVALVATTQVSTLREVLRVQYFEPRGLEFSDKVMFVSSPTDGAAVFAVNRNACE